MFNGFVFMFARVAAWHVTQTQLSTELKSSLLSWTVSVVMHHSTLEYIHNGRASSLKVSKSRHNYYTQQIYKIVLRYCRITLALQFLALNSFLLCMHGAAYEVHTFPLVTYYVLGAEYVCVCVCKSLCVYGFRTHLSKKTTTVRLV